MAVIPSTVAAAPPGVATPDRVETRLGTLNFKDGVPDAATTQKLYDELDYIQAVNAFISGYPLVTNWRSAKDSSRQASTTTSSSSRPT